ncbi:HU family DNA-binding protein [Stutzerimonas stutzeri]|uniref:HU family DNA-binding protein n=1 Tax=Stutzerimonas stutzeri TaxID=316 RepID=UPI0015E2E461|nr:HU family DNA-binding protein [Stutzerimonas stutzeri]MBA1280317.1 HU family DNA-binding protein [Stutzerimonas stutzeri]
MRKPELIAAIASDTLQSKTEVERTVNSFLDVISKQLAAGNEVALMGFGTFSVKKRPARQGRNPQTGEPMQIAASTVPAFKAGNSLKSAVN